MKKLAALVALVLSLVAVAFQARQLHAQQPNGSDSARWDPWRFLLGEWTGEGTGKPGEGTGGFSFAFDLQGKILVRKNRADYPATKDRPAYSHEDLMVVYAESGGKPDRAVYFDNEGHVIHYAAAFSSDGKTLTLLSDAVPSAPRFRMTYTQQEPSALSLKFEIAPPGKPDSFQTYIQATAHRKSIH
jgi:hypothetical protein